MNDNTDNNKENANNSSGSSDKGNITEKSNTMEDWNKQWEKLDTTLFGKICSLHRNLFISKSVAYFFDKYFPKEGTFVETGCGTGESSKRIKKHERRLIPLDYAQYILSLKLPKNFSEPVIADIRSMPFEENSINGIWNIGVIEHFVEEDIIKILNEFYRVLKPGSRALLFIPPIFGSSELFLGAIEVVVNIFKKEKFQFMTDEVSKVRSKKQIKKLVNKSNLVFYKSHFSYRDLYTYYLVVCKKPELTK
jgi:ubiquinone/menaquinone biosynthesis C-methylase UbiE